MYFSTSIAAVALTSLLSVVSAQTYYSVNPDDIDQGTKDTWCSNQVAACGALCLDQSSGEATVNSCDTETLVFSCLCADNKVPNATEYSQTIPYFLCTHSVQTCVNNCGLGPCGATNPTRKNATSTATTATKTAGSRQTGTNGDDAPFDAATTGTDGRPINSDDDDAANGASTGSQKNGASALSSVPLNASAFTIMILSALCGAFVLQL
ncbi:hypothetical protein DRE_06670 [Drechslerella stenobrocha 248]|uniref:DUF7707 domain-containing protein n=1 Tax=Drechslerella stenobrocha 248 TaxID=1043628 RepID=W7HN82_9PEZI|nr:hypothetical protein DRE_06670 [Drechslerella stenobrocha 248]